MSKLDLTTQKIENLVDLIKAFEGWKNEFAEMPDSIMLTPKQEMLVGCDMTNSNYYLMGSLKSILGITLNRDAYDNQYFRMSES